MRAKRHAACRRLTLDAVAGGVPPCVSDEKRGFSPGRGKRPAASFLQQLAGDLRAVCSFTAACCVQD